MTQSQDVSLHVASALTTTAKELETHAASAGSHTLLEKHLQAALHASFALPSGWRAVKEHTLDLPDWPGRLGGADVAVLDTDLSVEIAIELKWCKHKDKFEETLWDLYKMALAAPTVGGSFLAYAAPKEIWASSPRCSEIFATDEWNTAELFHIYKSSWKWLLTGNFTAHPIRFPARVRTTLLPIEKFGTSDDPWELRAIQVAPWGLGSLWFDDERWPACPECGSQELRPVVFGLPSAELGAEADAEEVVLGGCCCWGDERDPAWSCLDCGLQGGSGEGG